MSLRNRIRAAGGTLYVIAIVISLFAGGFVWVAIVGALLLGLLYSQLGGWSRRRGS
jgi:hypothetical protein